MFLEVVWMITLQLRHKFNLLIFTRRHIVHEGFYNFFNVTNVTMYFRKYYNSLRINDKTHGL